MRAAQFFNKGDIRVVDVDAPIAKDGEILVAVEWSGICGSDLHEYNQGEKIKSKMIDKPHSHLQVLWSSLRRLLALMLSAEKSSP